MILTVTLNPSIDKNYIVQNFKLNGIHRAPKMMALPGGKGINVSRVLHSLGVPTKATGIVGGFTGKKIEKFLKKESVPYSFVQTRAESRTNILILDEFSDMHCEINEQGPSIPVGAWDRLYIKLKDLAPSCSWVVFAGSPPSETSPQIYYRLIKQVQEYGVKVALDTRGKWLEEGIKAKPNFIKPNWDEFQELVGPVHSTVHAFQQARRIEARGVDTIIISTGSNGALAIHDGQSYCVRSLPKIEVVSPVGSGDSLVAGFLAKFRNGSDFPEALRHGLALGCSNATNFGAGLFDLEEVNSLSQQIDLDELPY